MKKKHRNIIFSGLMKLKILPFSVGPLSAIKPFSRPLAINFPWSLGKTSVRVSPGKLFYSRICVQQPDWAQEYQTCTDTAISGYQFTPCLSEASEINFLSPEKFTLSQCRQGPLNLQSNALHIAPNKTGCYHTTSQYIKSK